MNLLATIRRYKLASIPIIFILLACLLVWAAIYHNRDYRYDEMKRSIYNWDYYFENATIVEHHVLPSGKTSAFTDFHFLIPIERAQEMLADEDILYCSPLKTGCPDKTWQPYNYYVTSYGKAYARFNHEGKAEVRYNNPAIPALTDVEDKKQISCTMYQRHSESAYGLCVHPNTGDVWYHHYD